MTATVYRAPMWSRLDEVDRAAAVRHALERRIVAVGGRLSSVPLDLEEAVEQVACEWDARLSARLRRFADVEDGSCVWTQDDEGLFHRGVIRGPWRYDDSAAARDHDLTHVRACLWSDGPLDPPAAVVATFARGGRNFQRIRG